MPRVLCQIHDDRRQGAALVCGHLAHQIRSREAVGAAVFVDLDGFMMRGLLCSECVDLLDRQGLAGYLEHRKHPPVITSPDDGDWERLEVLFSELVEPVCQRCFEESAPGPAGSRGG